MIGKYELYVGTDIVRRNLSGDWAALPFNYLIMVKSNPNEVEIFKDNKYDFFYEWISLRLSKFDFMDGFNTQKFELHKMLS